mmetsp:Transcript_23288/g.50982  ORF Transcript_23288/g.50982 Transcript_23288/m.50982 type:complete len:172 (+) Transcript_23288:1-516(+)
MGGWGKGGGKGGGKGKGGFGDILKGLIAAKALPGTESETHPGVPVFVGSLPRDTTDLDLYKVFGTFGAVPPRGIRAMVNDDGSCKGFGFVNYLDANAAQTAIMTLNGTMLPDGKSLIVKLKTDKSETSANGTGMPALTQGGEQQMGQPQMPGKVSQGQFEDFYQQQQQFPA